MRSTMDSYSRGSSTTMRKAPMQSPSAYEQKGPTIPPSMSSPRYWLDRARLFP